MVLVILGWQLGRQLGRLGWPANLLSCMYSRSPGSGPGYSGCLLLTQKSNLPHGRVWREVGGWPYCGRGLVRGGRLAILWQGFGERWEAAHIVAWYAGLLVCLLNGEVMKHSRHTSHWRESRRGHQAGTLGTHPICRVVHTSIYIYTLTYSIHVYMTKKSKV